MSSKDSRFKTRRTQAREGDYVSCSSGDEPEEVYSNAVEKEYVGDVQSGDESYREEFYTGRESSAREEQPMPFLVQGDDAIDDSGLASDRVAARGPVVDDADIEKLFLAARHGKHKELKTLLDKGIPPNMADQHGNTILIIACQNGNKRVAKVALRKGADINVKNVKGNTPLHFCFQYGYGDSLGEYLISKGADASARNRSGYTCYELAP